MSEEIREAIMSEFVHTHDPTPDGQEVKGEWYAPKWGCDTLDHILDNVKALSRLAAQKDEGQDGQLKEALSLLGELMSYDNFEAYPPYAKERVKDFVSSKEPDTPEPRPAEEPKCVACSRQCPIGCPLDEPPLTRAMMQYRRPKSRRLWNTTAAPSAIGRVQGTHWPQKSAPSAPSSPGRTRG